MRSVPAGGVEERGGGEPPPIGPRPGEPVWDHTGPVPVVWQEAPGPLIAAIGFRVGRADEPLARSGLTHLVEHLAVSGLGRRLYDYDGFVNGTTTWFGFRGEPDELVAYASHLSCSLRDLPLGHLATELGVLRAEEARRGLSIAGRCLMLRYGTRGWGAYDLPQYGLFDVEADRVAAWAARWFGAGNAVVWMTGPPPGGFGLDLPAGRRHPEPPLAPLARRLPAWTTHDRPVTAASLLLPRGAAAVTAAAVLQARLRHVVRDVDASSYDVSVALDELDGRTTHVLVTVDGPSASVVEALAAVSEALAADGPEAEELDHERALEARRRADPMATPGRLAAAAAAALCGWTTGTGDVTAAAVAAALAEGLAAALYLVPVGTPVPSLFGSPLAALPVDPVDGRAHRPAGAALGDRRRLVVSAVGVSERGAERTTTVRTADASAVLAWRNGARLLVGHDGTALAVDPSQWQGATPAMAAWEAALPDGLLVGMGERPPWSRPVPTSGR